MTLYKDILKLVDIEFNKLTRIEDQIKAIEQQLVQHTKDWGKKHPNQFMPSTESIKRQDWYDRIKILNNKRWIYYGRVEGLKQALRLVH